MLGNLKFASTHNMMSAVSAVGKYMLSAAPSELSIGNIVRRVLFLIREEYSNQLRIAEEESKFGLNEDELAAILQYIQNDKNEMNHIRLVGLMGMATFTNTRSKN